MASTYILHIAGWSTISCICLDVMVPIGLRADLCHCPLSRSGDEVSDVGGDELLGGGAVAHDLDGGGRGVGGRAANHAQVQDVDVPRGRRLLRVSEGRVKCFRFTNPGKQLPS